MLLRDRFIDEDLLNDAVTALLRRLRRAKADLVLRGFEAAGVVEMLVPGVS